MPNFLYTLIKRLRLNKAHGQLVILILLPISVLMAVGSWLVYQQVKQNYLTQQYYEAQALLIQHGHRIEHQLEIDQQVNQTTRFEPLLRPILAEQGVLSAYVINRQSIIEAGKPVQDFDFYHYLQQKPLKQQTLKIDGYYYYATPLSEQMWLMVQMNHDKFIVLQYRVVLVLLIMVFLTILFLTFALYFFIQHWLNPLYQIRTQMQRLTSHNLNEYKVVRSSGELWALQLDILHLLKQLNRDYKDLNLQVQEENYSTTRMMDDMELKLVQAQDDLKSMHSMNQMKVMFLTNISHELRTPLNSIEGFVQLLLRQDSLTNDQRLYLQTIKKSSSHLLALINDVLDYSKIEAGKLQLDMRWFNLEHALYDVLDMLSPLAAQKNLQLIFYYPHDVPTTVLGDELRLKQIVTNLVSNAIKFTPDGEIIVRVRVEKHEKAQYLLHFSVQDSGIGIKKSQRDKLFESFNQADASITRQYGGTGLGLAISKELVHMMKGTIGLEDHQNVIDTGTTFWFTVLFNADVIPEIDVQRWHDVQVLYHLQHPATSRVLRYYFDEYQIHYQEASSVYEFLTLLKVQQAHKNQWVILDYAPNMEPVLQQIREYYQGHLAVYGDVLAMDMALLQQYQTIALAQPIHRQALWQMFDHQQTQSTSAVQFDGQHLQILAVDDHFPNLLVLEALLQTFNIQLVKANSGKQALALIEQRIEQQQPLFDLIFMDIQMPIMSGLDTTRAIRSLESTLDNAKPMPIIALSAHILEDEKQNLYECGMNDTLEKPVQLDELNYMLHKWIQARNTAQQAPAISPATPITDATMSENMQGNISENAPQQILDWDLSVQRAANKADLAKKLLQMLVGNFEQEQQEIAELIELEDFPPLEPILHRIHGATRYVGTPQLQQITGEFEQFVSQLRKQQQSADEAFAQQVQQRFEQLKHAIQQVEQAVKDLE